MYRITRNYLIKISLIIFWLIHSGVFCAKITAQELKIEQTGYEYYKAIADELYEKGLYAEAVENYLKATETEQEKKSPDITKIAQGKAYIGETYHTMGLSNLAIPYIDDAIKLLRTLNDSVEVAINLANKSHCLFYIGDYSNSLICMTEALAIERKLGNEEGESINLNAIGKIYEKWNRPKDAIVFYEQALEIDRRHNHLSRIAIRLSSIGSAYKLMKDFENALKYQQESLSIENQLGNRERIAIRMGRIGEIHQEKGDFKLANGYFHHAHSVFKELSNANAEANMCLNLARNYLSQGKHQQAIQYYQECLQKAEALNLRPTILIVRQELASIMKEQGDYKQAYNYLEASTVLKDSLFSEENLSQINEFREKYEAEKKESENKLLLKDIEIKHRKQRFFVLSVILLALMLVIVIALYRIKALSLARSRLMLANEKEIKEAMIQKKDIENKMLEDRIFAERQINRLQSEKHTLEQEHKNMQLANATICLIRKNETLQDVMDKLRSPVSHRQLDQIIQFIKTNIDIDQDWNRFKLDFEQTYPGFFDRLHSKFGNLAEHDHRLCAYILIGLSSKEIARLTNLSVDAISKSRQRLRKKMNLQAEIDLAGVLKAI